MSKKGLTVLLILLLAATLRFYKLGQNPPSLDWDEASIGYNAYSLLKTGKDEYGNSWPISIRSFNDYKPPLYTYLTIPSVALFGLTEFAVRFPSALAGTLTVLLTYFLVKELFGKKSSVIAAITALLLAISPWHLQFSRVAFEANLALLLFVLSVYLFLRAMDTASPYYHGGAAVAFVATMYSYHSARAVVPLFLLVMAIIFRKRLLQQTRAVVVALVVGVILMLPMGVTLTRGAAQARFATVSVFTNPGLFTREEERLSRQEEFRKKDQGTFASLLHHRWLVLTQIISENYFDHFNLEFLFLRGDGIGRHNVVGMGLLYFWELPFLIAGAYYLVKNKEKSLHVVLPWLLVAPAASALTTQSPHAVRSLLMLPIPQIITAYGIIQIIKALKKYRYALVLIGVVVCMNFVYYLQLYYIHTPIERSHDWQYGYKQLVEKVSAIKEEVDEVIITTKYDQPYIYFLFYGKVDPAWYQTVAETGSAGFENYFFRAIQYERDRQVKNAVIVGAPIDGTRHEIPDSAPIFDTIQFLDGKEAFRLVKT